MFYRYELEEMINTGRLPGNTVQVVRKNGLIFDVVL
ncbi:competence regulator inhibitor paratox [Streptococcus canis]